MRAKAWSDVEYQLCYGQGLHGGQSYDPSSASVCYSSMKENPAVLCMKINRDPKCFFCACHLGYTEIYELLYKAVLNGAHSTGTVVAQESFACQWHSCFDNDFQVWIMTVAVLPRCKAFTFGDFKKHVAPFMIPLLAYIGALDNAYIISATSCLPPSNRLFRSHEIPEISTSMATLQEFKVRFSWFCQYLFMVLVVVVEVVSGMWVLASHHHSFSTPIKHVRHVSSGEIYRYSTYLCRLY